MGNTYRSKQHRSRAQRQTLLRRLFYQSKRDAKKRKKPWEIEFGDFVRLVFENCYLCGRPPSRVFKRSDVKRNTSVKVNGLDRVDNSKGYTLENSKPCCTMCNMMKRDFGPKDFNKQIKKIFTFNQRIKLGGSK